MWANLSVLMKKYMVMCVSLAATSLTAQDGIALRADWLGDSILQTLMITKSTDPLNYLT